MRSMHKATHAWSPHGRPHQSGQSGAARPWRGTRGSSDGGSLGGSLVLRGVLVSSSASASPRATTVVVVESPTKAVKIQRFLGDCYTVLASYGHIRDLPPRTGSVDPDHKFEMTWQLSRGAGPRMALIEAALVAAGGGAIARKPRGGRGAAAGSGKGRGSGSTAGGGGGGAALILATDPDREGEAISWHLEQELLRRGAIGPTTQVSRITFTEVTEAAVLAAMAQPRQVSSELVHAYMARRALDYLVGFTLSPVLWRRLPGAKSAGRVQSVALRLVSDREAAIEVFVPTEYWSIGVELFTGEQDPPLLAQLTHVDGKRLPDMGITNGVDAEALCDRIRAAEFKVLDVTCKTQQRSPPPPFTTSTMQQEASSWLGFGASRTMSAAQKLYEGAGTGEGLITYMRTDGLQLADEALSPIRETVEQTFGGAYVSAQPRVYKSRAKNAQEAHEAVRPTKPSLHPMDLPASLAGDCARLYELIWRRSLACQMSSAAVEQVGVNFESADRTLRLRSTSSVVRFPGFMKVYDFASRKEARSDASSDDASTSGSRQFTDADAGAQGGGRAVVGAAAAAALSSLAPGRAVTTRRALPEQHSTRPPGRYTEASLTKALEELGIGRPSTYAGILTVLLVRGYVIKEGRALHCSPLGRVLSTFLAHHFSKYVDYGFTARMEEQLDDVSGGRLEWTSLMSEFWAPFSSDVSTVMATTSITDVYNMVDEVLGPAFFRAPALPAPPALALAQPGAGAGAGSAGAGSAGASGAIINVEPSTSRSVGSGGSGSSGSGRNSGESAPAAAASTTASTSATSSASAASSDPRSCPACGVGRLCLKPSKSGGFIGCDRYSADGSGCKYARPLAVETMVMDEGTGELVRMPAEGHVLGVHPDHGLPIVLKNGPYGMYLELVGSESLPEQQRQPAAAAPAAAEAGAGAGAVAAAGDGVSGGAAEGEGPARDAKPKRGRKRKPRPLPAPTPKRASLPRGVSPTSMTLAQAVLLLSLPRMLGVHPDDGQPVVANTGMFGPYVAHADTNASLGKRYGVHEVTLDDAVQVLAAKAARAAARAACGETPRAVPGARRKAAATAAPRAGRKPAAGRGAGGGGDGSGGGAGGDSSGGGEAEAPKPRGRKSKTAAAAAAPPAAVAGKSAKAGAGASSKLPAVRSLRARAYSLFQKEPFADARATVSGTGDVTAPLSAAMTEVARRWRELGDAEKAAWDRRV